MDVKTIARAQESLDLPVVTEDFIEDTITRVTGAPLIAGNDVRLLIDAEQNYPEWLSAIRNAKRSILFESYIIHGDEQGEIFANALIEKAREGVDVKLIYDWMGGFWTTSLWFWRRLRNEGIEVRCYNPPKFTDPLSIFSRDHRKCIVVDSQIAFVSGLCVGRDWTGNPEKNIQPWRDTGVKITGPAVAEVEAAFANIWKTMGPGLDIASARPAEAFPDGGMGVRVVQSEPATAHIYRIDQLLAATVQETMWLTDAYFVGVPSYLQSLKDASKDGVDVRILVPQSTDIAIIRDTTRSTYRPLLEAGVRVFEWNGPMVHAKTAVFDGRFSRVGSTNLNIASWFGNYELDVLIQNEEFGRQMQKMFLRDLENSTEIVLDAAYRRHQKKKKHHRGRRSGGSVRKATAGAINAATSISSAIAKKSPLGAAEARLLFILGMLLLAYAVLLIMFPRGASSPLVVLLLILAFPTLFKALQNYRNY